jgi:pantoate--beta-alanine ligase
VRIIDNAPEMLAEAEAARRRGKSGLVPTMGYFHEGHLSLMRRARAECDWVAVSLYVNPAQFGAGEDLAGYPRDFERDCDRAGAEGADVMFAPASGLYAQDHATFIDVERLSSGLCGASRPGHFRGVATVVAKLFNILKPHRAYFGMKDFQQVRVIETMVRDLNFDLEIVRCPIIREADGLAMSSRNSYLSPEERRAAAVLYRSLRFGEQLIREGERRPQTVVQEVRDRIAREPLAGIDYVLAVSPDTLQPLNRIGEAVLLALAVRFGRARLIDNLLVETGKDGNRRQGGELVNC